MDPHWRPVYVFCTPCSFHFKYILKFEHIRSEQRLFSKLLGEGVEFRNNWSNRNNLNVSEDAILEKYFSLLSTNDVKGLVDLYRPDFLMFNYTFTFRNISFI